jgi:AP-1 complex subunit beta-1
LLELIQTKLNYVVQEAIIVIKDIFRKYPNQYESIISTLCENLQSLDDPEAKAAMIWIVGEYAGRIDNADELLASFLENFHDENGQVQLQLLTATVKLFLKKPKTTQHMVQRVLEMATKESDNPDLRDRGFIYWRLLSTDPEAAKSVVLPEKPLISDDSSHLDQTLLEELLGEISTLASVFHKPSETFISKAKRQKVKVFKPKTTEAIPEEEQDLTGGRPAVQASNVPSLLDLGDIGGSLPSASPINPLGELFGAPSTSAVPNKPVLLPAERGKGLQVSGSIIRRGNDIIYDLNLHNQSPTTVAQFAVQFNHNSFVYLAVLSFLLSYFLPFCFLPRFGLAPANQIIDIPPLSPGQNANAALHLVHNGTPTAGTPSSVLQVAIKHGADISYFKDAVPLHVVYSADGRLEKGAYVQLWKSIPDQNERVSQATRVIGDIDPVVDRMESKNVFAIARRKVADKVSKSFLFSFS